VKPRVLVTDAEERSVLAACRGLARAGYRVGAAASVRPAPTHWSRFCAERHTLPDPRHDARLFTERLAELIAEAAPNVLLAGTEASLLAISERREGLEGLALTGLPGHGVVERSLDKIELLRAAEIAALAPPESVVCGGPDEALAAARRIGFPVIVKPRRSLVHAGGRTTHQSARVIADEQALAGLPAELGTPFVVQRYEVGRQVLAASGVRAGGRLRAVALARYHRTWPPGAGPSSHSETVTPSPDLFERVETLLASLGWEGVFQLQLLELPDGRFAALDLNPRVFGSLALPIRAGANLPAVWCDWLLGRGSDHPFHARAGVHYRWEEGEARNLLRELRSNRFAAALRILRPRARVVHALFEPSDPGPLGAGLLLLAKRARRRSRRSNTPR
jgi:predicted ATP-grasp superfamily ATP-dependent carboligase